MTLQQRLGVVLMEKEMDSEELHLRQLMWVNHGCSVLTLYGDDGEMQCNNATCRIDFKRMPFVKLVQTLIAIGRLHCGIVPVRLVPEEDGPADRT